MCKMVLNNALNGVELYFTNKPEKKILDALKGSGFRWSPRKKCWYARQSEKTLKLAQEMAEGSPAAVEAAKPEKAAALSLWDRLQFTPGNADTSKYHYKFVGSNYTGLTVKETAKIIRKHLKARFPEIKFSVTSDYNSLRIYIMAGPYNYSKLDYRHDLESRDYREHEEKHNKELKAILGYCEQLASSYNFDNSDSMTDYFHTHFYKTVSIYHDYKQTEQSEKVKADIANFREKLQQEKEAEEARQEAEFQANNKLREEQKAAYEEMKKEEAKKEAYILQNIEVKDLAEQYFVTGCQFADINKNETLEQYREEVKRGKFTSHNVKITREIHFQTFTALRYFSGMLLSDFEFIAKTGGSYTEDPRIETIEDYFKMPEEEQKTVIWNREGVAIYHGEKLQFVVDAQGYNYARFIGLGGTVKKKLPEKVVDLQQYKAAR